MTISTSVLRISRARALPLPSTRLTRRTYATEPPQRSNSNTWIIITAALGIPAAYYLLQGNSSRGNKGLAPSDTDQPATRKDAAGQGSMSSKQEGLSNANSSNPFINEPYESKKGEGETDSAKLKGTVSPQRPAR